MTVSHNNKILVEVNTIQSLLQQSGQRKTWCGWIDRLPKQNQDFMMTWTREGGTQTTLFLGKVHQIFQITPGLIHFHTKGAIYRLSYRTAEKRDSIRFAVKQTTLPIDDNRAEPATSSEQTTAAGI